jgi:hypothetical protein
MRKSPHEETHRNSKPPFMEQSEAHHIAHGQSQHLLVARRKPLELRAGGAGVEQTDVDQRLQIIIGDDGDGLWVTRGKNADLLGHQDGGGGRGEDEKLFLQKAKTM